MRLRPLAAIAAGLLLAAGLVTTPSASETASAETDAAAVARITNEHRAANGLPALKSEANLNRMAQSWANTMSSDGNFRHSTNAWRTARATAGYTLCCGENIAYGYTGAGSVVKGWMGSPGHRANILDKRYTHIGTGYAANGKYWVQVFAAYPGSISTTAPKLSGSSKVGGLLTATVAPWSPRGVTLVYRWYANDVRISGASGTVYRVKAADVGKRIKVVVTGTIGSVSASRSSGPTPVITR